MIEWKYIKKRSCRRMKLIQRLGSDITDEYINSYIEHIKKHKGSCDEVWLATQYGFPSLRKHEKAEICGRKISLCRNNGISAAQQFNRSRAIYVVKRLLRTCLWRKPGWKNGGSRRNGCGLLFLLARQKFWKLSAPRTGDIHTNTTRMHLGWRRFQSIKPCSRYVRLFLR